MQTHKLGNINDVPESTCLSCGKVCNAASVIDDKDSKPKPGDVTICLGCGHIMAFSDDLSFRELTSTEMIEVAGDERIIAAQKARSKVMPRSWKPEVQTSGDGDKWSGNAVRFATKDEAERYVKDLMWRWTAVTDTRVVESDDPVNYAWDKQTGLQTLKKESEAKHGSENN